MNNFNHLQPELYSEQPVLDCNAFVQWKKGKGLYNFDCLPGTAIITLNRNVIKPLVSPFQKRMKGMLGINYFYGKDLLLCSEFGSGAPAITCFLEELRALGVRQFIFLGLGGRLTPDVQEGEAFVVEAAHSLVGSSFFYSSRSLLKPIGGELFQRIKSAFSANFFTCLTTDGAFRETPSLIQEFRSKGATHIEMECAAIYAFSELYKIPSVCVLISADSLTNNQWSPPENMRKILNRQREIAFRLIQTKGYSK